MERSPLRQDVFYESTPPPLRAGRVLDIVARVLLRSGGSFSRTLSFDVSNARERNAESDADPSL